MEATTALVTSQVPEQPDPAAGDAATNAIITTAIDGSGTAAEVDLRQPAVLPDGQASALRQALSITMIIKSCPSHEHHLCLCAAVASAFEGLEVQHDSAWESVRFLLLMHARH